MEAATEPPDDGGPLVKLLLSLTLALAASACALTAPALADAPGRHDRPPQDAQAAVLAAFDRHAVVAISSPDVDGFVLDLLRNPELAKHVDDIAVECGNALYQPLLDRYIAGADVPLSQARKVWRDTTQPSCGFSTFYEQLFVLVRRINQRLPARDKLRVLACDPPIDWSKVHSPADHAPFEDRDKHIATVMKRQVLSKHRTALMLFGGRHFTRENGSDSAVARYEKRYPHATFVVADHRGFAKRNDRLERRMASWPKPSLMPIEGSWLETLDSSVFPETELPRGSRGYPGVDAYLYQGPRRTLLRETISPKAVLDEQYVAEMRRRADAIESPPDSLMHPEQMFRQEREARVLLR